MQGILRLGCGRGASGKRNKTVQGSLMRKKMHTKSIAHRNCTRNLRLNTDAKDTEKGIDAVVLGWRTSIHEISSSCNWDALFMIDSNWICTLLYMPPATNLQRMTEKGTNRVLVYSSERKKGSETWKALQFIGNWKILRPKQFSCSPEKHTQPWTSSETPKKVCLAFVPTSCIVFVCFLIRLSD